MNEATPNTWVESRHILLFTVSGLPKPAGSKRAIPIRNPKPGGRQFVVVDACKQSKDWKLDVAWAAKEQFGNRPPVTCAIRLDVTFFLPRPKSHYGTGSNSNKLKESAPTWHTQRPDATKLLRCVEDALTGLVWRDDAQIVWQRATKGWDDRPRAIIEVQEVVAVVSQPAIITGSR